mmetsp:Transcript_40973/g.104796  ORF Transcript_40973/g.104796 Transcript_40973/m.104796 type:complete len:264 (-) Transcript_40973:177-968(-)
MPHETTPTKKSLLLRLRMRGPPLSPSQASTPSPWAHSMLEVTWPPNLSALLHSARGTCCTVPASSFLESRPRSNVFPKPITDMSLLCRKFSSISLDSAATNVASSAPSTGLSSFRRATSRSSVRGSWPGCLCTCVTVYSPYSSWSKLVRPTCARRNQRTQCAAVTTTSGVMRVPPQWTPFRLYAVVRATKYGKAPGVVGLHPTQTPPPSSSSTTGGTHGFPSAHAAKASSARTASRGGRDVARILNPRLGNPIPVLSWHQAVK